MNNYKQSYITDRNTFVDEFESDTVTIDKNEAVVNKVSEEEREFNSKIRGNFDKIINYNSYAGVVNEEYTRTFVDDMPSSTTMQFSNEPASEIYRDYRPEVSEYDSTAKMRGGAKALVMVFAAIILALSILIVFNTALLNNMNGLIAEKTAQIEVLEEKKALKEVELEQVSSDETVIESAKEYGMVEGE